MRREIELDYLRGIAAFLIVVFHYSEWSDLGGDSEIFLSRIGLYGVSIFYILSGLTLYLVYQNSLENKVFSFYKKRVFRIYPLLILIVILTLFASIKSWDLSQFLFNVSGLFSLFCPANYIAVGSWSIGNELTFYLLFPLIMFSLKRKWVFWTLFGGFTLIGSYYATQLINAELTDLDKWRTYVQPWNHVFLFYSGIVVGYVVDKKKWIGKWKYGALILLIGVFLFYPTSGESMELVMGLNRLVFSVICIGIVVLAYVTDFRLPKTIDFIFRGLGEISYGVYLFHPLPFFIMKRHFVLPTSLMFAIGISITLILSWFSYKYFEKYFIKLGKGKVAQTVN